MMKNSGVAYFQRMNKLINAISSFIVLDEWVQGQYGETSAPDISFVDPTMTATALDSHHEELKEWSKMFQKSLNDYRKLLEMSKKEWLSMSDKKISEMEKMVFRAAQGVKLWI